MYKVEHSCNMYNYTMCPYICTELKDSKVFQKDVLTNYSLLNSINDQKSKCKITNITGKIIFQLRRDENDLQKDYVWYG